MMGNKIVSITLLLLVSFSSLSQEKTVHSKITKATVFLNGAQIQRQATSSLKAGRSVLVFDKLPMGLNDESLQVKGIGDFMILSVAPKVKTETSGVVDQSYIDTLRKKISELNDSIKYQRSLQEIYKGQIALLGKLDNKFDPQKEFSLDEFKDAMEFQNKKLTTIKLMELRTANKIVQFQNQINKTNAEIRKQQQVKSYSKKQVELIVSSKNATKASFTISYYINNAGWNSTYDIRVDNINKPVEIVHKANVFQSTGEDWNNVLLTLSNGNPLQSGIKPTLANWYLDYTVPGTSITYQGIKKGKTITGTVYDNEGSPIPGANIVIEGTTLGTVSDFDGKFKLNVPKGSKLLKVSYIGCKTKTVALTKNNFNIKLRYDLNGLDEVVVVGYGTSKKIGVNTNNSKQISVPIKAHDNQTSVEFKIDVPYSVSSGGEKKLVQIQATKLQANYQYYCVPKLDKDAFLIAKITDWEKCNFSTGDANLYFEGTYLGKSKLNTAGAKDTLYLSLGRDKGISVERTEQKEQNKTKQLGNKKTIEKAWTISVKNNKKQAISILIEDQLPLSITDEIKIEPSLSEDTRYDEDSGMINWELTIPPQKSKEVEFKYTVKCPVDYMLNNL